MESIPSVLPSELTKKQQSLSEKLDAAIATCGIDVSIDSQCWALASPVCLDVEHDENGTMVGIGLSYNPGLHFYFTEISNSLAKFLLSTNIIAHNGKSDLEMLRLWGVNVQDKQLIWDTMLMGHIQDSSLKSYGLKDMSKRELGIEYPSYDDIVGKRGLKAERVTLDKQPIDLVAKYNALDVHCTYSLYEKQKKAVKSTDFDYFGTVEKPCSYIFQSMENRGVSLDLCYLTELKTVLENKIEPIKAEILNQLGNINLNSPKQLLEALHGKGIAPTLKGKPSTDKRALQALKGTPLVAQLLGFSELETLLSSFVNPYLKRQEAVMHPFFNQCGTRTGRPSCSNPNLLQIPRRTENGRLVRRMFVARPGMLMGDCDFGQIEPRILAHLSKDPALCSLFNDGIDFHEFTAENLGIDRERAKVLNLSVGYRATFKSVAQQLRCSDKEAQDAIDAWWRLFPALRRWQDRLIFDSKRSGFCSTIFGRRIKVDNLSHGNLWRKEAAERQLINNVTQGSAAEVMKMAMIRIARFKERYSPDFGLLVQVYDELLAESSDIGADLCLMKEDMENCVDLEVPLVVEAKTGSNWAECH